MKTKKQFFYLVVFFSFLMSVTSQAYILPSEYICRTWMNKHHGSKNILLQSRVISYKNEKPTDAFFYDTTWIDFSHKKILSLATNDLNQKLFYSEKSISQSSPIAQLLFGNSSEEFIQTLKNLNIPALSQKDLMSYSLEAERRKAESVHLGHWSNYFVWMISQFSKDDGSVALLAFEKDTFLPLKFRYKDPIEKDVYEFRMELYFHQEYLFPQKISFYKIGSQSLYLSQIKSLSFQSAMPAWGSLAKNSFTAEGKNVSTEVQSLIQLYYESAR